MAQKSPQTLLVVDDEDDLRELFVMALSDCGFRVSGARSGREAMALLAREPFLGVLTDIRMPDGTGLELLDYIVRQPPERRPFVVLSSGFHDLTAEQAVARGAVALIAKPIDLGVLLQTVEEAARAHQAAS